MFRYVNNKAKFSEDTLRDETESVLRQYGLEFLKTEVDLLQQLHSPNQNYSKKSLGLFYGPILIFLELRVLAAASPNRSKKTQFELHDT